jgi:hypothetical protein
MVERRLVMKKWRVFNVTSKHPDKVCDKLEKLLTKLDEEEWEVEQVNGPFPMAIAEGSKEVGKFLADKEFRNCVMTTFCAFVLARK